VEFATSTKDEVLTMSSSKNACEQIWHKASESVRVMMLFGTLFVMVIGTSTCSDDGSKDDSTPALDCAEGEHSHEGACVAWGSLASAEEMVKYACPDLVCKSKDVVDYWVTHAGWTDNATVLNLNLSEFEDGDVLKMSVLDANNNKQTLDFEAGKPVTLTVNVSGGAEESHTFTASKFFRSVAWRKAKTVDGEYEAPHFDSFFLQKGAGTQVVLYFVPMQAGTWEPYCHLGVTNGVAFSDILSDAKLPDLATGHSGRGMKSSITVAGDLGVTLDQGVNSSRSASLSADPRRLNDDAIWASVTSTSLKMIEQNTTSFAFEPEVLSFEVNTAVDLHLISDPTYDFRHDLTAPELFQSSVTLGTSDSQGSIAADYFDTVRVVNDGAGIHLYIVPTVEGEYTTYCSEYVEEDANGNADLTTGHAGSGMKGTVNVTAP
jgi:hypothetical protein